MESHISQVFFISNLQPHGVKRQHLYVQSIGNLLGLMMIVRHIFIKILIDFALPIHVLKRNQNYTSVSNIIFDVYISELGLKDMLKLIGKYTNMLNW